MSEVDIMRFELAGWSAMSRWGLDERTGGWWAKLVPDDAVSQDAARVYFPASARELVADPWTLGELISIRLQCPLDQIERAMLAHAPRQLVDWLHEVLAEAERAG